jgi:hypothetical protein
MNSRQYKCHLCRGALVPAGDGKARCKSCGALQPMPVVREKRLVVYKG